MASSKLADAEGSKLSRTSEARPQGLEGLTSSTAVPARNKSFRLFPRDLARLSGVAERLGVTTGRRVSEADVVRASLLLADRATPESLLEALKDSAWE